MERLLDKLQKYSQSDFYPFHMPGHKRAFTDEFLNQIYRLDITEIEGFDNLHDAGDILRDIQILAAKSYRAEESFLLINGSTCGILSAISASVSVGGHLLVARNCHKSVYHAAYLRNAILRYIYPTVNTEYDIYDPVTKEQVEKALIEDEKIEAVVITSPTYEGMIADISGIAKVVHAHGAILIVDEAHGAHLGLQGISRESSVTYGADLVIHSLHKTLPSLTQTALLHVCGERVDRNILKRFLRIYQSSSPSYIFMASMEQALWFREGLKSNHLPKADLQKSDNVAGGSKTGLHPYGEDNVQKNLQENLVIYRKDFLEEAAGLSHIRVFETDDICKLLISVKGTSMTGQQLYKTLLEEYHLQMEMVSATYVLAIVTFGDTKEGFFRLTEALKKIDAAITKREEDFRIPSFTTPEKCMELREAWDQKTMDKILIESENCICGEFVYLYPPGAPLLLPGERITGKEIQQLQYYLDTGLSVKGLRVDSDSHTWIPVLNV